MENRSLRRLSFVVAILLVGAIFYSGALTTPYSGAGQPYAIAHESTEAFEELVDSDRLELGEPIPVTDLSDEQRRAFEEAKAEPPNDGAYPRAGWQSAGTPTVCEPALLVCDEYAASPNPADDGSTYSLVEDAAGEVYLVRVGYWGDHIGVVDPDIIEFIAKLGILGPYALFLVYRAGASRSPEPTRLAVGYGGVLLLLVLAYPYLLMVAALSPPPGHLLLLAAVTWSVILLETTR